MKTKLIFLLFFTAFFMLSGSVFSQYEKPYALPENYDRISEPGLLYICHITHDFVSVLDTKTNELIGKIPCGNGSTGISFSPDRKTGYITNWNSNDLTIFDTKTNKTIETVIAGVHPVEMLVIQNGKYVLISHESSDGTMILNTENNRIINRLRECTGPLYLLENKIYQPQIFIPYFKIIDPVTLEVIKSVETGGRPMSLAFINNNEFAYLANYDSNEVLKIDLKADSIIKKIKNIKNPRGIASTPDGRYVYVTNVTENTVTVINTAADSVETIIYGFKMPVYAVFSSENKFAYIANQGQATISIVNTETFKIIKVVDVADNPIFLYLDNGF